MIYFTLPNFFNNFLINKFFINLNASHKEYFKMPITFKQVSGSFPYCSWSGYNSNEGQGALYGDFYNCHQESLVPIRLDFSNTLLEKSDYYDRMGNVICEANENGSNLIEISSIPFMEHLREQYPHFSYIFSKNADLITPFSTDLLNNIDEQGQFSLIGLPFSWNFDINRLKELSNKSHYELTVNSLCPFSCKNIAHCKLTDQEAQLEYSANSIYNACFKVTNTYFDNIIPIEELKKYTNLGFRYFTFNSFKMYETPEKVFDFYVKYFIKEEYQSKVYSMFYVGGIL